MLPRQAINWNLKHQSFCFKKMDVDWFCCLFSTFNQSITNSDRGIFEPNTTNIATLENRKNSTDSRNNAFYL
jgi:hypothetical protein